MTTRTIKTNEEEAQRIMDNKLSFIIRSDKDIFHENDIIEFMVMKDKKPVTRSITGKAFIVTTVMDWLQGNVVKGHQIIGFRRVS